MRSRVNYTAKALAAMTLLCSPCFSQGADNCGSAQLITGAGSFTFDNTVATTDGSPLPGCGDIERDVWFLWTAPSSGEFRIGTCGQTAVNTALAVMSAGCGGTVLACNDNACSLQSRVIFQATGGTDYWIRLGSSPSQPGGSGTFKITQLSNSAGPWTTSNLSPIAGADDLILADLDGDGDLDAVTGNGTSTDIYWYKNSGFNSNWPGQLIGTGDNFPVGLAAADIDGDGDLDLVASAWGGSPTGLVLWYENVNANGSTWTKHVVSSPDHVYNVDAADVDGDGDQDIVAMVDVDPSFPQVTRVVLYENSGGGLNWTAREIGSLNRGWLVRVEDVDHDGDMDVLAIDQVSGNTPGDVKWLENDGLSPATFTARSIGAFYSPNLLDVGDVDGDGDLDVLTWNLPQSGSGFQYSWHENDGALPPTFTERPITNVPDQANAGRLIDLDRDGDLDMVIGFSTLDTVVWWENDVSDGSTWTERSIEGGLDWVWDLAVGDVNRDGENDVVSVNYPIGGFPPTSTYRVRLHRNLAEPHDGLPCAEHTISTVGDVESLSPADVDGDGDIDVFTTTAGTSGGPPPTLAWHEDTSGDGSAWTEHIVRNDLLDVDNAFAADMDGDGDLDVLATSTATGRVAWYENNAAVSGPWTEYLVGVLGLPLTSVSAADIDGDGDLDVIACSEMAAAGFSWFANSAGDGQSWSPAITFNMGTSIVSVTAGDINSDGNLDIISCATDGVRWHDNQSGDGLSMVEVVVSTDIGTDVLATDLNGDGKNDVIIAGPQSGVLWYRNGGGGQSWVSRLVSSSSARRVSSADINQDGALDIVASHMARAAWHEKMNSAGTNWRDHTVAGVSGPWSATMGLVTDTAIADVDGDGDLDSLVSIFESTGSRLVWYENLSSTEAIYYEDLDGDGYGNSSIVTSACQPGPGLASTAGDCDDMDPAINPGEVEVLCNGIDDNCNGQVDEGPGPDCNGNGTPDDCDILLLNSFDCDGNGIPDECEADCNNNGILDSCDISGGASLDCDLNGVPDECEPDCNGNGIADACDLAMGTSTDCNSDGTPDECEDDCDGNGIADECDLISGSGTDCNGNGVLDQCDLASGTSTDCNNNGVPDECDASPDCNNNGVLDECDVLGGVSADCNGNNIPDECEIAENDCNFNFIPDECDIASGVSADCNLNGLPDICELGSGDCNGNGVPDECELSNNDCNGNGIPDECDPDCNGNFTPDACETLVDCNTNGIPDECELLGNDCNSNLIPDECDPDCNDNGVPDTCDISGGSSVDSDSNGEPDECNPGTAYCFGDGTGSPCPCSALGGIGEGCPNSSGTGATLAGTGLVSVANDTLQLHISGAPAGKPGLLLRGNNTVSLPIGDGILCTTGASSRSHVQITTGGTTTFTNFAGVPFGSVANNPGTPTNFQFWFRDPANTCTGTGFNFSNAWSLVYTP